VTTNDGEDREDSPSAAELDEPDVKYRDLLEGVGAAIFALDLEGRFLFLNEGALDLLGYEPTEASALVGEHFTKILEPEQAKVASELFRGGREIRPLTMQAVRKDGTPVMIEVSGAWVRRRGRRVGALAMAWGLGGEETPAPIELSKLDMTILGLVSNGLSNREIAERVYLSTHTIKDRIEKMMRQFEVSRRAELAAKAARQGLV
jgi:PAS domain S-box-containing protein